MAKNKKGKKKEAKKPKEVKEPSAKEYALITTEELSALEARHNARLVDVKVASEFIEEALASVEERIKEKRKLKKWVDYLKCEGLPKAHIPPDIRMFFVKLRTFEEESVEKTIDWQLAINERSVLSQNIFRKDLTRKNLIRTAKNFGDEYSKNIDLGLRVIKSIEFYLKNKKFSAGASERLVQELLEVKVTAQQEIMQFYDRYAYRVLCSENAYMQQINAIIAEYCYGSSDFEMHLWTLKHVPILFNMQDYPSITADLHKINVQLQLPFSVLKEDLTLRALHFNYDHFSEHCKSNDQEVLIPEEHKHACLTDIDECLKYEWIMLKDIQNDVRNKMILTRMEYEEKMKLMEEEAARKEKEKKGGNKKGKKEKQAAAPKKPLKEPPIITEDLQPDVWEDFIEKENKSFDDFINDVYHPRLLNLADYEINLKKEMILGGIYQVYFVTKPDHVDFRTFNITWHTDNGNLFIDKDLKADLASKISSVPRRLTQVGSTLVATEVKRHSTLQTSERKDDTFNTDVESSPFFVITFKLPPYLCLWGEPQPCHYEADVVGFVEELKANFESLPTPDPFLGTEDAEVVSTASGPVTTDAAVPPEDDNASQTNLSLIGPLTQSNEDIESDPEEELNQTEPVNIEDFDINLPMTKLQIRNIQRHCVPRIISSFKFPIEIVEDEAEELRNKPKGQGGTLVRKPASETSSTIDFKTNERIYNLRKQNNPERVFPKFPPTEMLAMPCRLEGPSDEITTFEPQTFFELIDVLDNVKKYYRTKANKILEWPVIEAKFSEEDLDEERLTLQSSFLESDSSVSISDEDQGEPSSQSPSEHRISNTLLSEADTKEEGEEEEGEGGEEEEEESEADEIDDPNEMKPYLFSHWSKQHILHSSYDKENCKVTIWTDRLGTFGFAFNRYEHFPFRYWSLEPSEENPESEVVLRVDTQFVRCFIYISMDGYRGYVTDFATKYVRNPVKYLEIEEPTMSLRKLKKTFRAKHLNIFSKRDARLYIENGYFSEKHLPTELHCYSCIAIHCGYMKFRSSDWNRLSQRRQLIFRFAQAKEPEENLNTVRVTPEDATFVEITELCSNDLDDIQLEYTLTWRNYEPWVDLHHMITSTYPGSVETRMKDPRVVGFVRNILKELRLLSFS